MVVYKHQDSTNPMAMAKPNLRVLRLTSRVRTIRTAKIGPARKLRRTMKKEATADA